MYRLLLCLVLLLPLMACKSDAVKTPTISKQAEKIIPPEDNVKPPEIITTKSTKPSHLQYSFSHTKGAISLIDQIPNPKGFTRVAVVKNSFAEWLRYLPTKAKRTQVQLYNGDLKSNQNVHYAIVDIDVGKQDLQQCADAVMRLRAEYLYAENDFSKIHFNFTSGDKVAFDDWSKGRKPRVLGNTVSFSNASSKIDTSYPNFRKYMDRIFNYAGTASLSKELKKVAIADMQIGDVFIQGGFPGHAIIVMDMVENEAGAKQFLLAQSYMPAQDIHILKNYENADGNPWYSLNFGEQLSTPEWGFTKNDLKRFK